MFIKTVAKSHVNTVVMESEGVDLHLLLVGANSGMMQLRNRAYCAAGVIWSTDFGRRRWSISMFTSATRLAA